ncbi:ATP-binding protein [Microvirga roseola]|uniref:ATP-binding protein n=1 Tax=Microvirga roseola TaxID=2883126 RepID=UPI001E562A8C|nr:ATP-binding protein [Microvirga roseola]
MAKFGIGARVIDLLGRQQVAGTPTAISELFKNAHDAYARNVEVDFYRAQDLFILRDDGVGMSREDFETRWLTAATDSKRETGFIEPPATDPDQPPRPVMGEKGIGRLSIAVLGKQVLVLTRRKTLDNSAPLVASLLHWSVFSLPNISLGDLDIPLRELPGGTLPDAACIKDMIEEARANLSKLRPKTSPDAVDEILADLAMFNVDPAALAPTMIEGPDLRGDGHGTHFYITPTHDALALDIDSGSEREKATPMEKALLGFSNTMVPGHKAPPMATRFRDHGRNGLWRDLIADEQFFTPVEFENADHRIVGQFDERGQFSGFLRVYGKEPTQIQIRWPDAEGRDTRCGPFKIDFAYVQGAQADSRLPPDLWGPMIEKLNRIGGLYIYRDGMRVLPYGDSDYDFLDIENRRTKKASYYFFSYRRMFGVIDISRKQNSNLVEKAGREGFQENYAYKQFKNILTNFFIQLAAEFFREGGINVDEYEAQKKLLNQAHKLLEKRQRQVAVRRRKFKSDLDEFFGQANARGADAAVAGITDQLRRRLGRETPSSITLTELRQLESDARLDCRGRCSLTYHQASGGRIDEGAVAAMGAL